MTTPWKTSAISLLLSLGLPSSGLLAADGSSAAGVWQKHQYSLVAMGFTSTYSCDGLADKLKLLLLAAGARADVKAQPGPCAEGFGRVDKLARTNLIFYTLAPAGPSDGPSIAGVWRPVTLAAHSPRELATGDCELVEQFRAQVLPMFTTRNLVDKTTCVPHQDSGSDINLKFESFTIPLAAIAGPLHTH
jgi:hypothetical protein